MARQPFIAGNWKMNPTSVEEAISLAEAIGKGKGSSQAQVAIFIPHPFLAVCHDKLGAGGVEMGAQSNFYEKKGAYTGATSVGMVKSVGAKHCLVGHSERRTVFNNDDTMVHDLLLAVLEEGLYPTLCIGETKEEYEAGLAQSICAIQLAKGLRDVTAEQMGKITIAYEPVWAIGTGLVCDTPTAQEVHAFIRGWVRETYGDKVADEIRIQYGGSVTPESVDELMAQPDIDGCLVGGASLDAAKFERIMNFK